MSGVYLGNAWIDMTVPTAEPVEELQDYLRFQRCFTTGAFENQVEKMGLDELNWLATALVQECVRRGCEEMRIPRSISEAELNAAFERIQSGGAANLIALLNLSLKSLRYLNLIGHPIATKFRCAILLGEVKDLNSDAKREPEQFSPVASKYPGWPVVYSPNPDFASDTQFVAESLSIAKDYYLSILGKGKKRRKPIDFEAPANRLALRLISVVGQNRDMWTNPITRKRLESANPPPWVTECANIGAFPDDVENWIAVGWKAILHFHNGHPEADPELRKIGIHRFEKADKGKSREAYIRAGIREKLSQAVRALHKPVTAS